MPYWVPLGLSLPCECMGPFPGVRAAPQNVPAHGPAARSIAAALWRHSDRAVRDLLRDHDDDDGAADDDDDDDDDDYDVGGSREDVQLVGAAGRMAMAGRRSSLATEDLTKGTI